MTSRYNQLLNPQEYVSQYVPLPLELIAQEGAAKQKSYDINKSALEKSALDNTIKSIEEHDDYRNQYLKSFNDQAKALLNDPNLDFGSYEGKQKVDNLIRQYSSDPYLQTLSRSIANKKDTLDNLEAIKKEKDAYGYWNDPLLKEEKLKQMGINPYIDENGHPVEYQRQTIKRRADHIKPVTEIFDKMKDDSDINAWAAFTGDKTAISTGKKGWEGISADKIRAIADNNIDTFKTSEGGQDFLRKFEFDYADQLAKLPREKQEQYKDQAVKEHLYAIGSAYIHKKKIEDAGLSATGLLTKKYEEDKLANSLIGHTIEGQTYNPIENDKTFNTLKDNGVFKTNNDGTIKIDWLALNEDTKAQTINPTKSPLSVKGMDNRQPTNIPAQSKQEKQKLLAEQMKKMADVTGFKGDVKADNYEIIASAYNTYNKARLFGEQLAEPVSNLESDKISRNWELTTAYDPNDISKLAERPELAKGDRVVITERQTNKNGEIIKKGVIINKDGERTPIAVKSNSIEDSGYFDVIGNTGIATAKYQVGEDNSPKYKIGNGLDIILETTIPGANNIPKQITVVANPRDKSQVEYRVVDEEGKPHRFVNYSDYQRYLESEYYTKIPEGISDTNYLLNQKDQFKENY